MITILLMPINEYDHIPRAFLTLARRHHQKANMPCLSNKIQKKTHTQKTIFKNSIEIYLQHTINIPNHRIHKDHMEMVNMTLHLTWIHQNYEVHCYPRDQQSCQNYRHLLMRRSHIQPSQDYLRLVRFRYHY